MENSFTKNVPKYLSLSGIYSITEHADKHFLLKYINKEGNIASVLAECHILCMCRF